MKERNKIMGMVYLACILSGIVGVIIGYAVGVVIK